MLEQIQQSVLFQVIDNYVGGRGLISEQEINGLTVSNIFVAAASLQDTGNYTCEAPALAANTSVNLHVLVDGEWRVPKCLFCCFSLSKNRQMKRYAPD